MDRSSSWNAVAATVCSLAVASDHSQDGARSAKAAIDCLEALPTRRASCRCARRRRLPLPLQPFLLPYSYQMPAIDTHTPVCHLCRLAAEAPSSQPPKQLRPVSAVVGAGPAGILTAVYLARRGHEVHLYDRRPSPLLVDSSDQHRAFVVALHSRGMRALEGAGFDLAALTAPGSCLQRVAAMGLGSGAAPDGRHITMGSPRIVGPRHAFCRAMVAQAQAMQLPAGGGRISFHWDTSFEGLDVAGRTATFNACAGADSSSSGCDAGSSGSSSASDSGTAAAAEPEQRHQQEQQQQHQLRYDLLVAADGGWSRVRRAAEAQVPALSSSVQQVAGRYKVFMGLPPSSTLPIQGTACSSGSGSCSKSSLEAGADGSEGSTGSTGSSTPVQLRVVQAVGRSLKQGYCMLFVGADPTDGTARGMLAMNAPSWEGLDTPADFRAFLARHFPALPAEWVTEVRLGGVAAGSLCLPAVDPPQQCLSLSAVLRICCALTPGCPAALSHPSLPRLQMSAQLAAHPLAVSGMQVTTTQLHGPSLLLVGDAGHGVTPRTGNGMNAALEDAWLLDQVGAWVPAAMAREYCTRAAQLQTFSQAAHCPGCARRQLTPALPTNLPCLQLLESAGSDTLACLDSLPERFTAARLADAQALTWLDCTAPQRAGTSTWGAAHPAAMGSMLSMAGRSLLRKATGGRWVAPPYLVAMNEQGLPYSKVKAAIQRDNALLAAAGLAAAVGAAVAVAAYLRR
jgi:kynurenine 3-monooxygenase